ncbi:MAG: hypothetical protein ACR2FY_21765 [Pirellulaceae bacterium]
MSIQSKNCPTSQKKLTREKPPTAPPQPVPGFTPIPCPRDQQAYALHLDEHTQQWIADKLKCAQPTVMRGIRRMEKWLATTLPEDRGEYTASEKLRLALARHERLMERLLGRSLREFRRSRRTIPMRKTITTKDGVDEKGEPVKIRIEEWNKTQIGRKTFLDAAGKASHEITLLAAGWLGPGNGSISMAEVMDPEERDRWNRKVQRRDAQIEELQASVAELKSRLPAPREESAAARPTPVLKVAENNPIVYQEVVHEINATSNSDGVCAPPSEGSPPPQDDSQNLYKDPPQSTPPAPREEVFTPSVQSTLEQPESPPTYRWSDAQRQEALDYHCQMNRLPPAKLAQASGIPDPARMTPLEAIRRGRPYIIYIDRSAEIQREWERRQREAKQRPQSEQF